MADRAHHGGFRLLMGIGLDDDGGHVRLTKGEDYVLMGGSEGTHERMQERVERFRETLHEMGTDLQRATRAELHEAAQDSLP